MSESGDNIFGNVISAYSRAQAIEDGVLVDVDQFCEAWCIKSPFKYPVALTSAVYEACMRWDEECVKWDAYEACMHWDTGDNVQSEKSRLNDILMSALNVMRLAGQTDRVYFTLKCKSPVTKKYNEVDLWVVIGPGDDPSPVITIMMKGED